MWAVQKRDFMGLWVDIYRAAQFEDADRFRKGVGGSSKTDVRLIRV